MMTLLSTDPHTKGESYRTSFFDLIAETNLWVHSLSFASVSHEVVVQEVDAKTVIWLVGYVPEQIGLLVVQGIVQPSNEPLLTRVINLSSKPIRIKRGQILSRLMAVTLE